MARLTQPSRAVLSALLLSVASFALVFVWLYPLDSPLLPLGITSLPGLRPHRTTTIGGGDSADATGPGGRLGETTAAASLGFAVPTGQQSIDEIDSNSTMASPDGTSPRVRLPQGTYVGVVLAAGDRLPRSVDAFLGIPYAQSTAGEARFRPARPLPASETTFLAKAVGPMCPRAFPGPSAEVSEDCLNLNVYRPRDYFSPDAETGANGPRRTAKALLPVVVYVHGGAFNGGTSTERNLSHFVANAQEPLVAINFNYRLGPLGFLPASLTAREGHGLLNLGLRDQQAMFAWVKDNIEAFGGDSERVTLMGLSAGAHSIGHHIMSYTPSTAPFCRAIIESGSTTSRAVFQPTHPRHEIQFREFLVAASIAHVPEDALLPALRALPLEKVIAASRALWDKYAASVRWPFQPAIDGPATSSPLNGGLIPDLPINSWNTGKGTRLPVITGFNTNEGAAFVPASPKTSADFRAFFSTLIPSFNSDDLDTLESLYPDPVTDPSSPYARPLPSPDLGAQWHRLDHAYGHYAYICPVLQTAHFLSHAGEKAYVYEYAARGGPYDVAYHGDEAPVVAHDVDEIGGFPGLLKVSDAMHGYWTRFAVSPKADPNAEGVEEWPAFVSPINADGTIKAKRRGVGQIAVFGEGNDERTPEGTKSQGTPFQVRELTEQEIRQCQFWWDRVELSQGMGRRLSDKLARL